MIFDFVLFIFVFFLLLVKWMFMVNVYFFYYLKDCEIGFYGENCLSLCRYLNYGKYC